MSTAALVMLHGWALNLRVFDELVEQLEAPETETNRDATRLENLVTKLAETLGKAMAASQQSSGARANQAR